MLKKRGPLRRTWFACWDWERQNPRCHGPQLAAILQRPSADLADSSQLWHAGSLGALPGLALGVMREIHIIHIAGDCQRGVLDSEWDGEARAVHT